MAHDVDLAFDLEHFAAAFERARATSGDARLEDFMPPPQHPAYADIGLELLRIDLELLYQKQQPPSLDDYLRRFPDILQSHLRFERLAFEDFRQRIEAALPVTPSEYARIYGIDVSHWQAHSHLSNACQDVHLLAIGSEFCGFDLIEELGRGAFGRVFLARQKSLAGRLVALKITRGTTVEPDRLAQLQHENIVPIYSVHEANGRQAICMPYVGRSTLAQVVGHARSTGRLPRSGQDLLSTIVAANDTTTSPQATERNSCSVPDVAPLAQSIREQFERANYVDAVVWIMARLASGLAHAHERGVMHRDLKPANVLFSDDGRPMILDFNLSDQVNDDKVQTAIAGGTLPYMSPEQLRSLLTGAAVDQRSDIYSLGVIFFELLTGRLPFDAPQGASADAIANAIFARSPGSASVQRINPETPGSIAAVVSRCLAPETEKRYQSASELREDLERHLASRPLVHAADRSPRERMQKWARRHPRLTSALSIGSAAALVLAALGAMWLVREEHYSRVEAVNHFHDFAQDVYEAQLPLSVPGADADTVMEAAATARRLLRHYGVLNDDAWRESASYRQLAAGERRQLDEELITLLHTLVSASLKQAVLSPSPPERQRLVRQAKDYSGIAAELAIDSSSMLQVALLEQRELIRRVDNADQSLTLAEVTASTAALTGSQRRAVQLLQQGRHGDALTYVLAWRDRMPNSIAAWLLLGVAHAGMGNATEAEECFTTCTRLSPQFGFSYFQRGLARHQRGEYAAAVADFSRYLELRSVSPAALINRALAYEAMSEHRRALADLDAALAAGARQTRVFFIRAKVRAALNDVAGAKEDVSRGLELTPTDAVSWLARGIAQVNEFPERALSDFRQALQLAPGNRTAGQNILHVLADRLHREQEALDLLDQMIAANSRDSRALLTRAVLRARKGDVADAASDAETALTIDANPMATLQAACAFAQNSRHAPQYRDQAFKFLAQSLGAKPALAAIALTDADLAPLRESEQFNRIVTAADVIRTSGVATEEATAAR